MVLGPADRIGVFEFAIFRVRALDGERRICRLLDARTPRGAILFPVKRSMVAAAVATISETPSLRSE